MAKMNKTTNSILVPACGGLRLVLMLNRKGFAQPGKLHEKIAGRWANSLVAAKEWFVTNHNYKMGSIKEVAVLSDLWLVQCLVMNEEGVIDPVALAKALKEVVKLAKQNGGTVHISNLLVEEAPKGVDVEALLKEHVADDKGVNNKGIAVYMYSGD